VTEVLDVRTDDGLRRALREVTGAGSWDGSAGRRLLRAVRDRATRNAAHVAGATGARYDRNLVDDVVTAAWVVLHEHTDRVLAVERPWAYVMRSAQQEVMAEALADRAVTSRTTASGRHRQQVWKVLVARVGAAAGQVAAALGHTHRADTAEQPSTGTLGATYRHSERVLVETPHESPAEPRERDGWYAAFIRLLVAHGADGPRTAAAVDHLADLFTVTPSKQWETTARHDPLLARLGLSPDQRGALVALVAGSRRDREAGRSGGLLHAVRAAYERGVPVRLSAADRKRVRTYVTGADPARRHRPAGHRGIRVASEAVRAEMSRQGVTQEAIAAQLGLRRQNVSTRLAGIVAWSPEQLATVADLLTVPVTRLLHNSRRGRADAVPRRGALTDC
jgi:hypothetical protein